LFSFFERLKTDPKASLKKVMRNYELPTFPSVAMETLKRLRDPDSSAQKVAEVLALDPGLSVRVLRMANSSAFSPRRPVENLGNAIALVGMAQLESIILTAAVGQALPRQAARPFESGRFWTAAARRAVLARELATVLCPARQSECFSAGFLQDLAIPFLAHALASEYGPVLEEWLEHGGSLAEAERRRFPWDHAEVGTWICAEWSLPESIASAIGGHHGAMPECPAPVALVAMLTENSTRDDLARLSETVKTDWNVPEERIRAILDSCEQGTASLARLMM
jgi:HD-like signal output (HDOD) protein